MRLVPGPEFWDRGRVAALVAAELFLLLEGIVLVFAGPDVARFVGTNEHSVPPGAALSVALAALVAGALVGVAARRPTLFSRIRRGAFLSSPLLVLWTLPALLHPHTFDAKPLALMLTTGLVAVALERTLVWAFAEAPGLVTLAMRRTRSWDIVAGVSIGLYVLFATLASVRLHQKGLTSIFDLALFENLLWSSLHGSHGMTLGEPYFGVHFEPILYAVLPVYALVPRTETLLAVQSIALGGAAVPLYLLGRRWMGPSPAATFVVFAYLAHPALHGPNFYDFHFLALSPLFVAWAAYFFVRRSNALLAVSVLGALLCREDVALGLFLVGAGLLCLRVRPKAAAAVTLASLLWFVGVKFWWMERFTVDAFSDYYAPLIRPGDEGFQGVARTLFTNPLYVVSTFFSGEKLLLALQLFVPFAWLPIRQWRTLPLLLPGLAIVGLAASDSAIVMVQFHYALHFLPYIALGSTVALAVRRPHERLRAVFAIALGTAVVTCHYGAFVRDTFRTAFHEVSFRWTDADERRLHAFRRITEKIPENAAVAAGEHEGPHLARRRRLHALKHGVKDARYVVFSRSSLRWGGRERVERALTSKRFGIAAIDGPFVLLQRGAPDTGQAALEKLVTAERL